MPKQQTHIRVVREWCVSLGVLTAISISREEADMKLAAYIPMLMREFPDAAYTPASLHAVARQCMKGFPTYPELADYLAAWWREHRPAPPSLPPPDPEPEREPPTPEQIAAVEALVADCVASLRAGALYAEAEPQMLDEPRGWNRARYLDAATLDRINPLPNGRTRA